MSSLAFSIGSVETTLDVYFLLLSDDCDDVFDHLLHNQNHVVRRSMSERFSMIFWKILEKKTDISKHTYVGGSVQNLLFYGYINNLYRSIGSIYVTISDQLRSPPPAFHRIMLLSLSSGQWYIYYYLLDGR